MSSLDRLLRNCPSWVELQDSSGGIVSLIASHSLGGGKPPRAFYLELRRSPQGGIAVFEQDAKRQCPYFCLERHINPDGSFCVFYGSENKIDDDDAARTWWSHLGTYLKNQVYAEKFKLWPLASGLSHADAAVEQIEMEALADPLGWKDEILEGMFRRRGWIANNLPRVSKDISRVLNLRTPCPRGCTWKHKLLRKHSCGLEACLPDCGRQHKPILRADCPHRETIEDLVIHEHRRQRIESEIIDSLYKKGRRCCGTMKFCALRDIQNK